MRLPTIAEPARRDRRRHPDRARRPDGGVLPLQLDDDNDEGLDDADDDAGGGHEGGDYEGGEE